MLHFGLVLSADLGLKTRIPSAQASYLLLFIWSPLALCLTCSLSWVSYSISRMRPAYLFSEFQNCPSWRTGLLLWFFPLSNLLVNAANGFSHQVIIVLSPQSSLSWCQIAPLSWLQSLVNYCWEPEFHIVQNAASFFPPKRALFFWDHEHLLYVQMFPCLLIFTKGSLRLSSFRIWDRFSWSV